MVAASIAAFLAEAHNREIIDRLRTAGVTWPEGEARDGGPRIFTGKTLVLTVTPQFALPSHTSSVPVAITNQESVPLSGEVTFFAPAGWKAGTADIRDLEPGETVTVRVPVTAPAGTMGTHRVQAAFTAADGRMSQFTARLTAGFAR